MRINDKPLRLLMPAFALAAVLALSACGPAKPEPTPTMSVDAIYTAAFQTLSAQQATQMALTPPTPLPTQTPLPTVAVPTSATSSTGVPVSGSTTAASTNAGGAQACDNSVFVNDVTVPDGTVMNPGQTFVKTWTLMNSGTCPWAAGYKLAFVSGEAMGGTSVPLASNVPAGQQAQISVSLTAPATAGDYTGFWQLQNPQGQLFGNQITVVIKVGAGGGAAASATATP
ncbi:MAG: NBR1-Ig-like domain-containing protein [Anaerolineae bacterium]